MAQSNHSAAGHEAAHNHHTSAKPYVIGYILSLILTVIPLCITLYADMSEMAVFVSIMMFAVLQFIVQLFFFMHIREGEKPRYNVMGLILGIVFVFTIVAGSMWIMTFNSQVH